MHTLVETNPLGPKVCSQSTQTHGWMNNTLTYDGSPLSLSPYKLTLKALK